MLQIWSLLTRFHKRGKLRLSRSGLGAQTTRSLSLSPSLPLPFLLFLFLLFLLSPPPSSPLPPLSPPFPPPPSSPLSILSSPPSFSYFHHYRSNSGPFHMAVSPLTTDYRLYTLGSSGWGHLQSTSLVPCLFPSKPCLIRSLFVPNRAMSRRLFPQPWSPDSTTACGG